MRTFRIELKLPDYATEENVKDAMVEFVWGEYGETPEVLDVEELERD